MKLLEGKTAIITGASRGIGRGIALVFAQHGANVAFTYSASAEAAKSLEEELKAYGIEAKGYQSNAADFNEAQKLVDDVVATFGTVDILINNASAISLTGTSETHLKRYDLMHQVNTRGTFLCSKVGLRYLRSAANPHILNI